MSHAHPSGNGGHCTAIARLQRFEDFHISEISTSKNRFGVVDLKYAQSYKRFANAFNHPSLT